MRSSSPWSAVTSPWSETLAARISSTRAVASLASPTWRANRTMTQAATSEPMRSAIRRRVRPATGQVGQAAEGGRGGGRGRGGARLRDAPAGRVELGIGGGAAARIAASNRG